MPMLNRLVAAYLLLVAVVVAVNFIVTPWYHPGGDEPFEVWEILNYFMAAGMVLGLAGSYIEKRRVDADSSADVKSYLGSNAAFYGTVAVFLLYFWNWFSLLSGKHLDNDNLPDGQFWTVIDALMPIVLGVTGCRMWRNADS